MDSYNKTVWVNGSNPPINAENLNHIESGIEAVTNEAINTDREIAAARGSYTDLKERLDHTGTPTDEQVAEAVEEYFDEHPISGAEKYVEVADASDTAVDNCTEPDTVYIVRVVSGVVTTTKMRVICTPNVAGQMAQYAMTKDGYIISRKFTASEWGAWDFIPDSKRVAAMISEAIAGKADSSAIPTKTSQLNNDSGFLTSHQDISGKENTSNKKTSIDSQSQTGDSDTNYPTVGAVRDYTDGKVLELEGYVDDALDDMDTAKADKAATLSGYGITDGQTKIDSSHKLSSDLVDDTNKSNKFVTSSEKTSWNGKYSKPSSGIPKTDLASAVQTSLGKADSALQSHQDISGKENTSNKVTSISSSSTNTEYPSALAVKNYVEHYGDEDYCNSLPPTIYTRVNGETKIYFRNIFTPNYLMFWGQYTNSTTIQNYDDYVSLVGTAAATKNVAFKTFDRGYRQIESGSTSVVISSTPPSSQKILIMGDSFVDGGTLTSLMRALFTADGNTLTAIGTKGTSPNYHEGYSGWKYTDFMNASKGAVANPFWNSNANAFDFSYYMNHNSFSGLNSVYIQLGTNDASASSLQTDFSAVVQASQTIINSILSYDSNIKVYLGLTVMPTLDSTKFALKYNGIGVPWILRLNMQRLNAALIAAFSKNSSVKIVATNCVLDSSTDISDNVHPNSAGMQKIAQQVYYTMMS